MVHWRFVATRRSDGGGVGDGDTTLDELVESLAERDAGTQGPRDPGTQGLAQRSERTHVRMRNHVVISDTGDECHTFIDAKLSAGLVPEINELLGLLHGGQVRLSHFPVSGAGASS